jgi:hypothetical protein
VLIYRSLAARSESRPLGRRPILKNFSKSEGEFSRRVRLSGTRNDSRKKVAFP